MEKESPNQNSKTTIDFNLSKLKIERVLQRLHGSKMINLLCHFPIDPTQKAVLLFQKSAFPGNEEELFKFPD